MAPEDLALTGSCWPLPDRAALLGALGDGRLDAELSEIIDAINVRTAAIAHERTQTALARLALHGRVRIGNRVKPQYLRGETGTVHGFDDGVVIVLLDRVIGKFTSRHARCTPEMVEPITER